MESKDKGLRFNQGKTRYDLIPAFAQEQYAKILTIGSEKYAERNWELGMKWSKVIASLERHLAAIKRGEDFDPETGCYHTAHIMCNSAFLTEYYKIYPQGDDRPHSYLSTPKIGLDIDEVLCNWLGAWMHKFDIKDVPTSWFFDRQINNRFSYLKKHNQLDEFYSNLEPLLPPSEIPFEPHCYITSRPVDVEVTTAWLDKHGFPSKPVYCVGIGQTKVDVAKESGIEIFVDDCYDNFLALNKAGICCYLYDTPHNQRYDVGHKRIKSLKELIK